MNVVVFGANGKTGRLVVERAVAAGHTVTAFVRDGEPGQGANVRTVTGDAGDVSAVRRGVSGQDAVIDTVGGKTPYKDTELERTVARNIIEAMRVEGVRRLLVVSMMGIGDSSEQTPFWYEHLLMPTFLRGATKDKTAVETAVNSSGLDFVIARPPLLIDDPPTHSIQIIPAGTKGHKITRADLAHFLVDQLTQTEYLGKAVVVANS